MQLLKREQKIKYMEARGIQISSEKLFVKQVFFKFDILTSNYTFSIYNSKLLAQYTYLNFFILF